MHRSSARLSSPGIRTKASMSEASLRAFLSVLDWGSTFFPLASFVLAMVIELDMLDWNQVRPFIKQFRTLDVDCSGRLGMHDLQIINSMSSDELAKLRRVNSLSRQAPMVAMKAKATAYFSQRELAGANGNRLSVSGPNVSV